MYTIDMNLMRNPMAHYIALTTIFFTLVLALPAQQNILNTYNLSKDQYQILIFLYVLPFIGIWYAAFLGFTRLNQYAKSIQGSVEAAGFKTLALGCGWLAYSLPTTATISLLLFTIENSGQAYKPVAVILSNYMNLIVPLIGFIILGYSARCLGKLHKTKMDSKVANKIGAAFIVLGLVYGYFTISGISLDSITSANNVYFIPIWAIVVSLIIPYLYSWFVGLIAAFEMFFYAKNSKGLIYRKALSYVGFGIATVIVSSIFVQFLESVSASNTKLSINYLFATAYFIEIILASGFVLIAIGSNKLKRIEEV